MSRNTAKTDIIINPPILIDYYKCDLCGACVGVCPPDCLRLSEHFLEIIGEDCIRCGFCLPACPLEALIWNENGQASNLQDPSNEC